MSKTTIVDCKTWLLIETDAGDTNVQLALDAAEEYVAGDIGQDFAATPPTGMVKVAVFALAGHWLEHREAAGPFDVKTFPLSLRAILAAARGPIV